MKLSSLFWVAGLGAGLATAAALSTNALALIHVGGVTGRHIPWRTREEWNRLSIEQNSTQSVVGIEPAQWETFKNRGCTLLAAMAASNEDAAMMIQGSQTATAESVFKDYPFDLTKWGYTFDTDAKRSFQSGGAPDLAEAMKSLGVRYEDFADDGPNYVTGWKHTLISKHDNVMYPPTKAIFHTIVNPEGGLVVGWLKYGPKFSASVLEPRVEVLPKLKNWADVAHLSWAAMCQIAGKDVKNLRYVVSAEILNTDTEKLIIHSLQSTWKTDWRDEECKNWEWKNRVEWSSDSEQFKVLLASPNGRGAAYMLIQHK